MTESTKEQLEYTLFQGDLFQKASKLPASPRGRSAPTTPLPLTSHEPNVLQGDASSLRFVDRNPVL